MTVSESTAARYTLADPDVRLMLQVRDDNAAAFAELVARYQNRLIAVLEPVTRSREQAEDLTQDVFVRVFKARKRYEPSARFSTWLFTIANNVANNALRKKIQQREVQVGGVHETGPTIDDLAQAASGLMPSRAMDRIERSQIVRLAIESLNERQRMALMLSKFEEMSYIEIAETMGLTTKAVKSLLSRARVNLKAILEPYMEEGRLPTPADAEADRETP